MSITKITVNVSNNEITLTLQEARELYEELRLLFDNKYIPPQLPQSPYKVWESPYTGGPPIM